MNKYVGYLIKPKDGLYGERGLFYDYVLAENGVFIETEGPLLAARVPVACANIRGLAPLEPKVVLRHGKIPRHLFDLALNTMLTTPDKERYVAVTFSDGYHINVPEQASSKEELLNGAHAGSGSVAGVAYQNPDSVLLEMHTHPKMRASFSPTDNRDETGLKLYGVIGHCGDYHEITDDMSHDEVMGWMQNNQAAIRLRAGVYGYFYEVAWEDIFEGRLGSEMVDIGAEEMGVSRQLLEEAYLDPGVSEALKEDIGHELYG